MWRPGAERPACGCTVAAPGRFRIRRQKNTDCAGNPARTPDWFVTQGRVVVHGA